MISVWNEKITTKREEEEQMELDTYENLRMERIENEQKYLTSSVNSYETRDCEVWFVYIFVK